MAIELQQIMNKLSHIESDLDYIKKHISDVDLVLTSEDLESINEAKSDLVAGKTKRLA